jgi:hypothetical protein
VQLNELAMTLFRDGSLRTSPVELTVPIIVLTVEQLGRDRGATWSELMASASDQGLVVPPLELAPHLRLQYLQQPEGAVGYLPTRHRAPPGSITVVSDVPVADDEKPRGFYLRTIEGTPWLRGYCAPESHVWSPADVLLFIAPE